MLNFHRNPLRFITDRERRGPEGGWRGGGREIIYLSLHCQHQNDSCNRMGNDESHFNVSLTVRAKSQDSVHKTQPF